MTNEVRNQEKKMFDIQSMFNVGMVSSSLNMSGMIGGLGPMGEHH